MAAWLPWVSASTGSRLLASSSSPSTSPTPSLTTGEVIQLNSIFRPDEMNVFSVRWQQHVCVRAAGRGGRVPVRPVLVVRGGGFQLAGRQLLLHAVDGARRGDEEQGHGARPPPQTQREALRAPSHRAQHHQGQTQSTTYKGYIGLKNIYD